MADTIESKPNALLDFRDECRRVWAELPDKGLFFGLLAAWLALFHFLGNSTFGYVDTPSLLRWMHNAYNVSGSEDGHGNLIPLVVLGLFWWKRRELLALPRQTWWPGLGLVALALALHLVGYVVQQPRVSIVAMFLGIYGLMGVVWGAAWLRGSFFPFVLLGFCVPVGSLAESITFPLRMIATTITVLLGRNVLGIPVLQDGVRIFDPNGAYAYEVAAACSGIRGLISLTALTTIYGFITFKAAWKQLLFVVLAAPLALLNNILRLTTIIIAAEAFGQPAGEFVDRWFGFLTFALALAIVLALGHWLREQQTVPAPAPALKPQSA